MLCKCLSDGWWSWRFEFMAIIPIYNAATKQRKECKTWYNAIDWRFCKRHWMVIVDSASGALFSTPAQTVSESTSLDKSVGEQPKLFVLRFEWDATFGCTAHWIANALTTCRPNPFPAVPHSTFQLPWSSNFPHIWSVGRSYRNSIPTPFVCIMSYGHPIDRNKVFFFFNEWALLQSFRLQNLPLLAYSTGECYHCNKVITSHEIIFIFPGPPVYGCFWCATSQSNQLKSRL